MFSKIKEWLIKRSLSKEQAGYEYGLKQIARFGLQKVASDFEANYALGAGFSDREAGILRAISEVTSHQTMVMPEPEAHEETSPTFRRLKQ